MNVTNTSPNTATQTFVHKGRVFTVEQEDDGKFVADIALSPNVTNLMDVEDWARVVGRFDSTGQAIQSAKNEIESMQK